MLDVLLDKLVGLASFANRPHTRETLRLGR